MKETNTIAVALGLICSVVLTTVSAIQLIRGPAYGTRLEFYGGEVFYTKNVEESDARILVQFLDQNIKGFENASLQIDRNDGKLIVRMCVKKEALESLDLDGAFDALRAEIQSHAFPNEPVIFEICDDQMRPKRQFTADGT